MKKKKTPRGCEYQDLAHNLGRIHGYTGAKAAQVFHCKICRAAYSAGLEAGRAERVLELCVQE